MSNIISEKPVTANTKDGERVITPTEIQPTDLSEKMFEAIDKWVASQSYTIIESDPQVRTLLKQRALMMVRAAENKDTVYFLDQKARPLAYLFYKLWPLIYPEKRMPQIRFLNIGSEKIDLLIRQFKKNTTLPTFNPFPIEILNSFEDLVEIYGVTYVNELLSLLRSSKNDENRLIVDDVASTSRTKLLSLKIMSIINSRVKTNHNYEFYEFIGNKDEDQKDRLLLTQDEGIKKIGRTKPYLPWDNNATLVSDNNIPYDFDDSKYPSPKDRENARIDASVEHSKVSTSQSFRTSRQQNWLNRKYGLKLRDILDGLVEEMKSDL